ncbi:hypothetical protein [Stenotrophomonas sp. PS02289]|uniref:hypothetical protein n=1 Tax=Stenotrophomonas sp. PS02289 TaxID=2991422 RepID=UPI00249CB788|nr:hypothetical protein [Stenotrophomonas sp. PS02289]
MRHPHRHRCFAPAMRGQRPALATVLAWLALLSMLVAGLPLLGHAPNAAATALQQPTEDRRGGELAEESPAKLRRAASTRAIAQAEREPHPPTVESFDALIASLADLPPHVVPAIDSAPAAPLPAAPGRRVQRGQAPPQS